MKIKVRGNPPRKEGWWYKQDNVCTKCRPATIYVIEQADSAVEKLSDLRFGNYLLSEVNDTVWTLCPICGCLTVTKLEDAA